MAQIVSPGDGFLYDSMGDTMRFMLTGQTTEGAFTLIEDTIKPGFHATLHLHRTHAETFYILEGEINFTIDAQHIVATPGTTIRVPMNTPHEAQASQPGKMLTIFSPAGLENALQAFTELTPEQSQDANLVRSITERFDIIDLTQPPIPTLLDFYNLLLQGKNQPLLELFSDEPKINAPTQGEVKGREAFQRFVSEQQAFLTGLHAQPHFLNVILTPERIVIELTLDMLKDGEAFDLPVALVCERSGEKISEIRVYHSTWPLTGSHIVRPPLLQPPAQALEEPELITAYMEAIHKPDENLLLSLFTEDGYIREPSGSRYKHAGPEGRKAFYGPGLHSGGITLHHCTATFDGTSFAVEYICDKWGRTTFAPQAGMAVYAFADANHLQAVRIYDDVTPPTEAFS